MMLRDVSNTAAVEQQQDAPPVVKTFERRRQRSRQQHEAAAEEGGDAAQQADAASPASSSCSGADDGGDARSPATTTTATAMTTTGMSAGLSRRTRRCSVLRGAALPGHQLFDAARGSAASRSLLLARMSKARRRAYLAFAQRMAAYFAEVDQFELLEESPEAAEKQPASRLLPSIREGASLTAAEEAEEQEDGELQQAANTADAGSSPASAAAAADSDDDGLQASTPIAAATSPQRRSRSPATQQPSLAAETPAQTLAAATPLAAQAGGSAASDAAGLTQQLEQLHLQPAEAPQQELQQQHLASLLALQASTPAGPATEPRFPGSSSCKEDAEPASQQQQHADEAAAPRQAKKGARQPKQQQQAAPAAGAEAADDIQQQAAGQERLAQAHFQAWAAQQATEEAQQQLQQLELAASAVQELTPLQQMLQACGQPVEVAEVPCMADFLADLADLRDVVKLGEGTYGEAFKSGKVVFKMVPMEGDNPINGWPQKGAGDLLGEAIIARALTGLAAPSDEAGNPHASFSDAFVATHRVGVCRGPYPPAFVKAWTAWDARNKSENDFIGGLPPHQLYAVFAMANCGRDLEGYSLAGWDQCRSLLLQVALALAVGEEALAFEHRDLHWGNVMLAPPDGCEVVAGLKGVTLRVRPEGARVRLIDFTASRLTSPGGDVVFCDLEGEEGLFDGPKGKPQFETYRRMRKLSRKDWAGSHPGTNVLWLLYLTELLLSADKPVPGATAGQKRCLREFKKRLGGYACCADAIWDELFAGLWTVAEQG